LYGWIHPAADVKRLGVSDLFTTHRSVPANPASGNVSR
jgi:hypothetical protein